MSRKRDAFVRAIGVAGKLREDREAEERRDPESEFSRGEEREVSELRKLSERKSKRRLW